MELNEVKSNISFSYNGSCVTSASGSGYWWWRSGSGWEPPTNKGSWISTTCNNAKVRSQADYRNTLYYLPAALALLAAAALGAPGPTRCSSAYR